MFLGHRPSRLVPLTLPITMLSPPWFACLFRLLPAHSCPNSAFIIIVVDGGGGDGGGDDGADGHELAAKHQ